MAILVAWGFALAGLVQRDVIRTPGERMADLALRVNPGNVFYAVEQNGRHIGYASSTIDTIADTLLVRDELVANLTVGGVPQRATARTDVGMSRRFALRTFAVDIEGSGPALHVRGRAEGDTAIAYVIADTAAPADTQRIRISGPMLLPTIVPLAAILGRTPEVGARATYRTFDPATMGSRDVTLEILAESLFVVDDSAKMDTGTGRWVSALRDTVRAWQLSAVGGDGFRGWIDAQGRVVETTQMGLTLRRMAYEMAFENWRLDAKAATDSGTRAPAGDAGDIIEASAIASGVRMPDRPLTRLRAQLLTRTLEGFDVQGGRQSLAGNVVTVTREADSLLRAGYTILPNNQMNPMRFRPELSAEPLLQSLAQPIMRQAIKIAGREHDPRIVVERIMRWVHDSIAKVPTLSVPNALEVLRERRGDCNEHAQLFTAFARAVRIPTRIVAGVVHIDGTFYYHAWNEVFLGDWVAVDPTFGQFPADAGHIRMITGGLGRQAALMQLIGRLHIEVLDAQ